MDVRLIGPRSPSFLSDPDILDINSDRYIAMKEQRMVTIGFQRVQFNLLKSPYATNCSDYREIGYPSQFSCLTQCILAKAIRNGTGLPIGIPYEKADDYRFNVRHRLHDLQLDAYEDIECNRKCANVACHIVYYETKIMSRVNVRNQTGISLYLPSKPPLFVNYKPLLEMTEFLTLLGSVLGLWFGISAFSLVDTLANVRKK